MPPPLVEIIPSFIIIVQVLAMQEIPNHGTQVQKKKWQDQQMIQISYAKDVTKGMPNFEFDRRRSASELFLPAFASILC